MARRVTTEDLIQEVRSMIDESNLVSVRDQEDILPALNRAQAAAANILARHYESPLLAYKDISLSSGEQEFDIPEEAFEERLEKIEVRVNSLFYPVKRIDYRDISAYETISKTNIPYYYAIVGNKVRLVPNTTGVYSFRLWYLQDPEPLVSSQGRITKVADDKSYVILDAAGPDLTVDNSALNCYVNVVDAQTGKIKGTLQVANIQGSRIYFKSAFGPNDRETVLNKDILTAVPATVEPDDMLCLIHGTCIPIMKAYSNYYVQFAVAEMQRKLGGPADMELRVQQELEKIVERSWVGRETSLRVARVNRNWALPPRRFFDGR